MALTKETFVDKIEVVRAEENFPFVQVREATVFKENGNLVTKSFNYRTITPASDTSSESEDVKSIANQLFTSEVVSSYKDYIGG